MPKKKETNAFENYNPGDRLIDVEYSDVMQKSYIDYAMSVIISRALPDIRDGLKPVQRRILYDMKELGTASDRPYRKSARIVGDTMGKYHPHGDSSIYGAMVVLAQDFKMSLPLVDGHGNFGSIEGDGAAAMRYTEARLKKFTETAVLADMDRNTVDFVPNFDKTENEPEVLPARFPNFLVNGSEGIAVGMTTSTPPHNLGEVIDAEVALIGKPDIGVEKLMEYIPGPDFPTGGIVANRSDLPAIYESGTGKLRVRGRVEIEKGAGGKDRIVISEIPYTMIGANIGKFLNDVAELVEKRTITGVSDISNQSSKEGIRIVLELKKDADAENIINLLYAKTKLEDTFGVNMLAIADGKPEVLGLKQILERSITFQYELNTRKYNTLLEQALKKKEIEEGLIRASDCIDLIIEILRASKDRKQAKKILVDGDLTGVSLKTKKSEREAARLRFTEMQADAILDMRLYRLIGLEIGALRKEYAQTVKDIEFYSSLLNDRKAMSKQIVKELLELKKKYASGRKTTLEDSSAARAVKQEPKEEKLVALIDRFGYIHTTDASTYERNREAADESYRYAVPCMNTGKLAAVTNTGKSHSVNVRDIPFGKLRDRGVPLENVSTFSGKDECVLNIFSVEEIADRTLVFLTKAGSIKRVPGSEFDVSKRCVLATKLTDGDELVCVGVSDAWETVVIATEKGYVLRFAADSIPSMKKASVGSGGIRLTDGDRVEALYGLAAGEEKNVSLHGVEIALSSLKTRGRNTRGTLIGK